MAIKKSFIINSSIPERKLTQPNFVAQTDFLNLAWKPFVLKTSAWYGLTKNKSYLGTFFSDARPASASLFKRIIITSKEWHKTHAWFVRTWRAAVDLYKLWSDTFESLVCFHISWCRDSRLGDNLSPAFERRSLWALRDCLLLDSAPNSSFRDFYIRLNYHQHNSIRSTFFSPYLSEWSTLSNTRVSD